MAPKHATREALLTYLRADTEPRHIRRIEQYMRFFGGVKPAATREQLRRLCIAGLVERLEGQRYRVIPG